MRSKVVRSKRLVTVLGTAGLLLVGMSWPAGANHTWNNYHWARSSNPFTVKLGDNVSSKWDSYLRTASSDWTKSTVLNTHVVTGGASSSTCMPATGRVEVCNATYGANGWLGLATVWLSGSHITKGKVQINDTYFNTAQYNDPDAKLHVMCQEVGHTFGLAHQGGTSRSCMNDKKGLLDPAFAHPNSHDYEQLKNLYSHKDSTSSVRESGTETVTIERTGPNTAIVTFIYWA